MKELNDIDFDKAFKTRITEELPEFEEESWLKMERKLRKRERLVYYRYASILLVLLSFGMGFYLLGKKSEGKPDFIVAKKVEAKKDKGTAKQDGQIAKPEELKVAQQTNLPKVSPYQAPMPKNQGLNIVSNLFVPVNNNTNTPTENVVAQNASNNNITKTQDVSNVVQKPVDQSVQNVIATTGVNPNKIDSIITNSKPTIQAKIKKRIPISVAMVAGPDFSSTSSLVGGKTGVNIGTMVGIGLTKKLSLQTGIAFGSKNYNASAYDYTFNNPNINKANYTEINAACKVVEIPLRASYNISENQKRSIELNAGLSSYLMIREQYVFKYTEAAKRADRYADIANDNQHYLSVAELSATYNIKLKNKQFAFGIEPYVKIPLTGIGEGNVPLKSSGVSLKLRYDFNKK